MPSAAWKLLSFACVMIFTLRRTIFRCFLLLLLLLLLSIQRLMTLPLHTFWLTCDFCFLQCTDHCVHFSAISQFQMNGFALFFSCVWFRFVCLHELLSAHFLYSSVLIYLARISFFASSMTARAINFNQQFNVIICFAWIQCWMCNLLFVLSSSFGAV